MIEMAEEWLNGGKSANLTVYITSSNQTVSGPTINLITAADEAKKQPSKVGMGVGIPMAFGAVAVIGVAAFCCIRRRRRASQGYLANKSRNQRAGAMQVEEDDFIGGTRGPRPFRDEPSRGVELQDRSRGHGRDGSLGSLASSSPTEEFGGRAEGRSNTFRDEISRQRTLRA